ncbi:ankyrin repeat-containing domain protein [Aspergillus heterothallicus]
MLVYFLKGNGMEINSRNHKGQTSLHLVGSDRAEDTGAVLIAAGADIEARDYKGRTWWLRTVLKDGDRADPEELQAMLDLGADANAADDAGNNALHLICIGRNYCDENFEFLLSAGANPLHINRRGETIYHTLMRHYPTYHSFEPEPSFK